jgi:3-oxoacyl-(acyl-carrier-protein) synthase
MRIVITGLGAVSGLGSGADALAASLQAGRSGIAAQPGSPAHALNPYAAAVVATPLGAGMAPAQRNLYDRHSLMAMEAAAEAWAQAGLPATAPDPDRAAVAWGTGLGGSASLEASYQQVFTGAPPRVHPYTVVRVMANSAGSHLAMRHQLRAAQFSVSNACASSAQAIGEALWLLRNGRADIALVGGSEAMLNTGSLLSWQAMGVMAPLDADQPAQSCRPFDDARKGLVLGEGAAALVIETEAHALRRGATPLAVLAGYGHSVDAVHLSRPDPAGQQRAMAAALRDAGLAPADIGYVNAHGTATDAGDAVEAASVTAVFGIRAVPISATKALHGHLIGAGGALELVATVQALRQQVLPPSAHVRTSSLTSQADIITGEARAARLRAAMSNSFAFGGSNVTLVVTEAG